ncbi:CrcB family protein [Leucobacter sp. cx-42]|uniref:fluoride efflux transporter FluC n=1 Tax=unclassified Leucobacter TaxID=2621730 RepID=UPI00165D89E5|nr:MULTISPECIES: CrcB family protein [unclassified Leucobacter]MBC9954610.1 CrcB family protein [Leucobacter sp. cx-42]
MPSALLAFGCVALGGGIGAVLRHVVDTLVQGRIRARYPVGITIVNLTGSFVLGLLVGFATPVPLMLLLGTGMLGGYTTFSTASLDTVKLVRERRYGAALANGVGMLVAAVCCAILGIALGYAGT